MIYHFGMSFVLKFGALRMSVFATDRRSYCTVYSPAMEVYNIYLKENKQDNKQVYVVYNRVIDRPET